LLLVLLYEAYGLVQGLVPTHRSEAVANARRIMDLEQRLEIDPEPALNRFVAGHAWLAQPCDYWYSGLHFPVAVGVAMWLLWRHRQESRRLLTAVYTTTALALLGFWLVPVAPPRLLDGGGFVDTVVRFHTWGGWDSAAVESVANQYAALPSLHMAWSLWCAIAVSRVARDGLVRRVAWLYPAGTLFVILGTGNHWLLDAAAGALVLAVGFAVASRLHPAGAAGSVSQAGAAQDYTPAAVTMASVRNPARRPRSMP
jgi:hypothetical protein